MILKGFITEMKEGGKRAKVQTFENEIIDDVLMLYQYGEASNIQPDTTSLVLLLCPLGSKTNVFGVPYNVTLQPSLEASEKAVGNFKIGNKITFKANGDVEITSALSSFSGIVNVAGVYKVDGVQVVGNQGAAVTAPTGGATIDAEARVAINAIISRMTTHGLIA